MDNYREMYKIKLMDAIKLNMYIIVITRNPHGRVRTKLNDILSGFTIFDLDRIGDTVTNRVEIVLGMMRYPVIKHPFKYIQQTIPSVNEEPEKKPEMCK